MFEIWNEDCISGSKKIKDKSVDLLICDPPFGISESTFDKHYARKEKHVLDGYVEAPKDYYKFTKEWMTEAKRVIKEEGTFYLISGWSNLKDILVVADELGFNIINHLIWKFNFGVNTTKKWVTSHYHILMFGDPKKIKFNTHCRFGPQERDDSGSLLYKDLEDVFYIRKEYQYVDAKNKNKLPNELIRKLILYSSDEGDTICDFFMGNFTTAYNALQLGRNVKGFEMNKNSYDIHFPNLENQWKTDLKNLKKVKVIKPRNQGKPLTNTEKGDIIKTYEEGKKEGKKKNQIIKELGDTFGRGKFSIINILKEAPGDSRP